MDTYPAESLTTGVKKHGTETYFSHAGICQESKPFHCHPQRSECGLGETPLPFFPFVARCHGRNVLFQGHSFSKRCVKYHWPYKPPGTEVWHVTGQPYTRTVCTHVCLWVWTHQEYRQVAVVDGGCIKRPIGSTWDSAKPLYLLPFFLIKWMHWFFYLFFNNS